MSSAAPRKAPRLAWWIATGLGSGWLRPAPGTWGSAAALLLWCALACLRLPPPALWALTPALAALAVWSSHRVVDETGLKDPGYIVIDEWAGLWIALLPSAAPVQRSLASPGHGHLLLLLIVPFLLFRLFDIWKPWPVHQLQSLPRGWGVVVDDLMAGAYAALGAFLLARALR